ncbi:unnamed protein product [Rotaria magnacalcarata]|uniref:Uncharacterized protein n=1 Tax=Rotaria magnacalcarata TaxID=392030 RepID=A0A816K158_9BILA|nr:unnamed protein product [Rotaria magnacalcarata]
MFSFVVFAFDLVGTGSTTNCPNRQAIEQSLNKVHIPARIHLTGYQDHRGNVTLYSNEGTLLAALVVECVAKISYGQYLRENIFKSLNIYFRTVAVRLSDFQNTEELVKHYAYAVNESFIQQWNHEIPQFNGNLSTSLHFPLFSFSGYPAGLLRMSAISLSMFLRMFINNGYPLFSSQSIAEMKQVVGGGLIRLYNEHARINSTNLHPS